MIKMYSVNQITCYLFPLPTFSFFYHSFICLFHPLSKLYQSATSICWTFMRRTAVFLSLLCVSAFTQYTNSTIIIITFVLTWLATLLCSSLTSVSCFYGPEAFGCCSVCLCLCIYVDGQVCVCVKEKDERMCVISHSFHSCCHCFTTLLHQSSLSCSY